MNYGVIHTTTYDYSEAVSVSHHALRLTPRETPWQKCLEHNIQIEPEPATTSWRVDYYGNTVLHFTMQTPHERLRVRATNKLVLTPRPAPDPGATPPWKSVTDWFGDGQATRNLDAQEFLFDSPLVKVTPDLAAYARESFPPKRRLLDAVVDLTQRIHTDFIFDPKATTVATPLADVFKSRRGVCQDFAHLEIACLRSRGLAARYVSGYLETIPPPGQPRLVGVDASHAWVAVYCPVIGWIDVDPTNNLLPSSSHITLGWGRDYSDISPLRGVILGGGDHKHQVSVDVSPLGD